MGAIRASIITGLLYLVMTFVQKKWFEQMSPNIKEKVTFYLPLIVVFVIETLL
jgi:hypothetical protein